MYDNINSGIGAIIAKAMVDYPVTGKVFIVGKAGLACLNNIQSIFGSAHKDGTQIYHTTIDSAVGSCVLGRGDLILVLPGHTETVTATSIALDIADVKIVNLGKGTNAPTYTYSTAAATITVSAANINFIGGNFVANFLDVASAFTVTTAKNFVVKETKIKDSTSILNFLSFVTTNATNNAADGLTVVDNYYHALNTTPLAFVSVLANENEIEVSRNFVDSASTADVGHFLTIAAKVILGARIQDNTLIVVGATTATVGIFLTGSSTTNTGIVSGNKVASLDTTTELIATAGTGLKFFENYYTGTADASGKLWPAVDGA